LNDRLEKLPALEIAKLCLASWLVPGLGYWLVGRKRSFAIVASCLFAAIIMGVLLGGDLFPVSGSEGRLRQIGGVCQMGMGLPFFLFNLVLERGNPLNITFDYGTNYFLIAGMVNWLAVMDIFDIATRRK
jgi:hypothetical protein